MKTTLKRGALGLALLAATAIGTSPAWAFGEAGPLELAEFGAFYVNTTPIMNEDGTVSVTNQMFVEYMIPENQVYPYPVVLVPGGGGHAVDWMQTVDGRDGWVQYLVNAGFAVYWVDRPGAGRSAANTTYLDRNGNPGALANPFGTGLITRLAFSEDWPNAPMIYDADGNPDRMAWGEANKANPTIMAWAAGSPTTPNASNDVQIQAEAALLEMIGPAVIFTHSAGGTTSGAAGAMAAANGNLVGILNFESGGANPYGNSMLNNSEWSNGAPVEANRANQTVEGADCSLQTGDTPSQNVTMAGTRQVFLYSEFGTSAPNSLPTAVCAATQARQAGLDAIAVYMPDNGYEGTGHFAMSELSSGEIATNVVIPALAWIENGGETDLVTH